MIFPINKKHTFFSKEKTLLTFFFILFISFSCIWAAGPKKLILLQTSDVHSRLEPINQEGDRNYDKGGFVRRATFACKAVPQRASRYVISFDCGDISQGTPYYNMFQGEVEVKTDE